MNKRHFEAGDQVDAISFAGEPFDEFEQDGIRAGVFTADDGYYIPIIESVHPGGGALGAFLGALRVALPDKPIRFVSVINQRLRARLLRDGFEVVEAGEDPMWDVNRASGAQSVPK